jgi:Ni/Co efflux regulator RcnB
MINMKMFLSLAAVAVIALSAAPAVAQHHGDQRNWNNDNPGRHGDLRNWNNDNRGHRGDYDSHHGRHSHHAQWSQGYRFGPGYSYTSYNSLPRAYARNHRLSSRYRYVYNDGYIYQVDPTTYAVRRVLDSLTGR